MYRMGKRTVALVDRAMIDKRTVINLLKAKCETCAKRALYKNADGTLDSLCCKRLTLPLHRLITEEIGCSEWTNGQL
jgi:hypothetical protein